MLRGRHISLAVALLALVAGCGGDDDNGDNGGDKPDRLDPAQGETDLQESKSAAETFINAVGRKDAEDACSQLAPKERKVLDDSGGCLLIAKAVSPEYKGGQVVHVRLIKNTAFITVDGKRRDFPMQLQRFDGDWQVTTSGL